MGLYKTDAIVLRLDAFTEAHRVVTLLTPDRGRLRAVAKGVRRPLSRLGAALQPFNHCRLLLWKGRSLDGISQAEVVASFRSLRDDLCRITAAMYLAELVCELVPEDAEPGRETAAVFRLMLAALNLLDSGLCHDLTLRYCELHLLSLAGFRPRFQGCNGCHAPFEGSLYFFSPAAGGGFCRQCASESGVVRRGGLWVAADVLKALGGLLRTAPGVLPRLGLSDDVIRQAADVLSACLDHVLEKQLKSRTFLDILRVEGANGNEQFAKPGGKGELNR